MSSILNVAKNCISILKGKIGDLDDSIVQNNPEHILNEAIKEASANLADYNDKIAKFKTQQRDNEAKIQGYYKKLDQIQKGIGEAQRDGAVESVKKGLVLYKEKEKELEDLLAIEKEIDSGIKELEQFILDAKREVQTLENEKTKLLVQLENAKTKEQIMNMKSSIKNNNVKTYNSKFNQVREQINKKVEHVKSLESLEKTTVEKDKYFDGI